MKNPPRMERCKPRNLRYRLCGLEWQPSSVNNVQELYLIRMLQNAAHLSSPLSSPITFSLLDSTMYLSNCRVAG